MSQEKRVCVFDNSKTCPVRIARYKSGYTTEDWGLLLEKACPICPIHADMMKVKHTLK